MFKLYPYQEKINKQVTSILSTHKRVFIQMPTGTGKTLTTLYNVIQRFKNKKAKVIWVAHQTYLVGQSRKEFEEIFANFKGTLDGELGRVGNITFEFMTWQRLTNLIQNNKLSKHDGLVIDEAHFGSSNGQSAEHVSFKTIIQKGKFTFHWFVSATLWDLNPDVFGFVLDANGRPGKKYMAVYTTKQAAEDGYLHDTDLIAISTVDTLKIKNLEDNQENQIEADSMKKLAGKVKKTKVNIKHEESKKNLRSSVVRSLLEVYIKREINKKVIPPTIIFCSSIDDKNDPRSLLNVRKEMVSILTQDCKIVPTKSVMYYQHSKTSPKESQVFGKNEDGTWKSPIDAFREGAFKILLVVSTAQEGFNKRDLQVIVDLCPSLGNAKRFTQKNRLTRTHATKTIPARYYIPDELRAYVNAVNEKKEIAQESLASMEKATGLDKVYKQKGITPNTGNKLTDVVATMAMFTGQQEADETGEELKDVSIKVKDIDKVKTSKDNNTYIVTTGLVVSQAEKKNILLGNKKVSLHQILKRSSDFIDWTSLETAWNTGPGRK